jgi:uncharacterized protein YfaP (DUF2135 family)
VNPPGSGELTITISWVHDGSELDAVIVTPRGTYLAYSDIPVANGIAVVTTVNGGDAYELRVHSYYGTQFFDVKAELAPFPDSVRTP